MRCGILIPGLLGCWCSAMAQNLITDPGFETDKPAWEASSAYGTRAGFESSAAARGGVRAAHLSTYAGQARFGTISQEIAALPVGVYELTVWARGEGKLRLSVERVGTRSFSLSDTAWLQYSYVFELPETGRAKPVIAVQGDGWVDDVVLLAATAGLRGAWERQQQALAQFHYIPSGYSAQRSAPNAPRGTTSERKPVPITDKVIFFDPRYEGAWNTDCGLIAEWFGRRGFAVRGAPELASWMAERIDTRAYGSVVVMGMGLVPDMLVEPLDETCLIRRYLDAGGRVVWTGDTALYVAQGETGPVHSIGEAGMTNLLDMTCDWAMWGGTPRLTDVGRRWGLTSAGSGVRMARRSEVTLSLSEDPVKSSSAVWLRTTNPEYPLSGFIASVFALSGKNSKALEDFYRLALFTDGPVALPTPGTPDREPAPFTLTLTTEDNGAARRAYVPGESVTVRISATSASWHGQALVRLLLKPNAPAMSVYDMAEIGMAEATAQLAAHRTRAETSEPLWTQTSAVELTAGGSPVVATSTLETRSLAVGDYELRAELVPAGGAVAAEVVHPLAMCDRPRLDGIYFGTRGPAPTHSYRLAAYLDELADLNLTGVEAGHPNPQCSDALLRRGLSFIPYLDARPYLTELKKGKDDNDVPNPWGGGKPGLKGLAGQKARDGTRKGMAERAKAFTAYPAFANVFTTSDDYSALGGLDWTPANLAEFREKTGLDAPREPTAEPGIIPADDPWLQWNAFLCRDVVGGLNTAIREGIQAGSPGARVWPVPGGAQWPLFMLSSGQYPPMSFGVGRGLNAAGYYCYLAYWCPSLAYLYWSEVARMGNRELPVWVMPNASDSRHYLRNQAHLLLAAGTKGIVYFTYGWMGSEGKKEIAAIGALLKEHGGLLSSLKPADKDVALLVPFSQACYRNTYSLNMHAVFANLVQAHLDVEPIAEEEIATSRHRVVLLSHVTHLSATAAADLEAYAKRGGTVLLDRDCGIELRSAPKLDVSFGQGHDRDGLSIRTYCRRARMSAVRDALAPHTQPVWDSPELTTVIRPFLAADGTRYAYVVQVDDNEEFIFYRRNVYEVATFGKSPEASQEELKAFLAEHGMDPNLKETTMTVRFPSSLVGASGTVVDVYTGRTLKPEPLAGGRWQVSVRALRYGGALLRLD